MAIKLIKGLLITVLLACCFMLKAGKLYDLKWGVNTSGRSMYRIVNYTNKNVNCYAIVTKTGYYKPIFVKANSYSDWYYKPHGNIDDWGCK